MHLLVELGGTNTRFALCRSLAEPVPECVCVIPSSRFDSVNDAIEWYLSKTSSCSVESVCLAIAGPARGPEYRLTNNTWSFEKDSIARITGTKDIGVVNDFAAFAAYLPYISENELVSVRAGCPDRTGTRLALGPGTGMGMAVLVPVGASWRVVASEGGNTGFSPGTPLEIDILKILHKRIGRIVIEDLLSGSGLVLLYDTLCAIHDFTPRQLTADRITELALQGIDAVCIETVDTFCGILGEYAGDMALTVSASGGVYLGGGILPRIVPILIAGTFSKRFTSKRKLYGFMNDIPVWLVTADYPALVGACHILRERRQNILL